MTPSGPGSGDRGRETVTTAATTEPAPRALKAVAATVSVDPVVHTSSTRRTRVDADGQRIRPDAPVKKFSGTIEW